MQFIGLSNEKELHVVFMCGKNSQTRWGIRCVLTVPDFSA